MSIQKLAGQTLWYGLSNILGRFLNYFLSILLVYLYSPQETAPIAQVYVYIPFLNILFTLGLETSYFRFSNEIDKQKLYNNLVTFIMGATFLFTGILWVFKNYFLKVLEMERYETFYYLMLAIVWIDTLTALPFAKLRQEGRPRKFAIIKFLNILINVVLVVLFLMIFPKLTHLQILPSWLYNPSFGIGYYILANLVASLLTLLMLTREWKHFSFSWDTPLIKSVMRYALPILIVGFGGMINDFLSRVVYYKVLDAPLTQLDHEFGVFAANYKLAVLATIFIQVFKMGAEPFFFNQAKEKNAPETYARITKIFVIICCFIFLGIAMNLDILQLLIATRHKEYAEGIHIVPILTLANIFLGIYYNLAVWYKLTDQTMKGAIITLSGVVLTIVLNIVLIPLYHYTGAAWATLCCYLMMMVVSYLWGQKQYPIPYEVGKCLIYLGSVVLLFIVHQNIIPFFPNNPWLVNLLSFMLSVILFSWLVFKLDRAELKLIPGIKRWV